MPADSCFGCCSIRSGVKCICLFNAFWIASTLMVNFVHRLSDFGLHYDTYYSLENNSSRPERHPDGNQRSLHDNYDNNYTAEEFYRPHKTAPMLSDIFMDYVIIVKLGWCVMEFYLNVDLQRSTYTVSPKSVYAWLVVYYLNLCKAIIFQIVIIAKGSVLRTYLGFLSILIVGVEVYIVRAHYDQQTLAAVSSVVELKWKYLPKSGVRADETWPTKSATGRCDLQISTFCEKYIE